MNETFKIFVHRLKEGQTEKIVEDLSPDFMGIHEAELVFQSPIKIEGQASVAENALVLRLKIETEARMPCSICNRDVKVKILIPDLCYTEELINIKSGVFDYQEVVREEILLGVPLIAECNQGDCPERALLAKYFTKST